MAQELCSMLSLLYLGLPLKQFLEASLDVRDAISDNGLQPGAVRGRMTQLLHHPGKFDRTTTKTEFKTELI